VLHQQLFHRLHIGPLFGIGYGDQLHAVRVQQGLKVEIPRIVDQHCGRLRWDFVQRLERSRLQLERELDAAKAAGDARKIKDAEEALAARRVWLDALG